MIIVLSTYARIYSVGEGDKSDSMDRAQRDGRD